MAVQTCGTCGNVETIRTVGDEGWDEIYVWMCNDCLNGRTPEAPTDDALFEATLSAEAVVRGEMATVALGADIETRARAKANLKTAREALNRLIDAMSLDQLKAYGDFRKAQRA